MTIDTVCNFGSFADLGSNANDLTEFFQKFIGDLLGADILTSGLDKNSLLGFKTGAA